MNIFSTKFWHLRISSLIFLLLQYLDSIPLSFSLLSYPFTFPSFALSHSLSVCLSLCLSLSLSLYISLSLSLTLSVSLSVSLCLSLCASLCLSLCLYLSLSLSLSLSLLSRIFILSSLYLPLLHFSLLLSLCFTLFLLSNLSFYLISSFLPSYPFLSVERLTIRHRSKVCEASGLDPTLSANLSIVSLEEKAAQVEVLKDVVQVLHAYVLNI